MNGIETDKFHLSLQTHNKNTRKPILHKLPLPVTRITSFHQASIPQSDLLFYPFTDNLPQRSRRRGEGGRSTPVKRTSMNTVRKEKKIYSANRGKVFTRKNDWVLWNKGKPLSAILLLDGLSIRRHWPFPLHPVSLTYKRPFSRRSINRGGRPLNPWNAKIHVTDYAHAIRTVVVN